MDLDIEGGTPDTYSPMVAQLLTHTDAADKTYFLSAAPQWFVAVTVARIGD